MVGGSAAPHSSQLLKTSKIMGLSPFCRLAATPIALAVDYVNKIKIHPLGDSDHRAKKSFVLKQ